MKKSALFIVAAAALMVGCTSADKVAQKSIDQQEVISKLSLEDKAHFVIGVGMEGFSGDNAVIGATKSLVPGAAGTTYPLDSLGIPAVVLADGPAWYWPTVLPDCVSMLLVRGILLRIIAPISPSARCWLRRGTRS